MEGGWARVREVEGCSVVREGSRIGGFGLKREGRAMNFGERRLVWCGGEIDGGYGKVGTFGR